MNYHIFYEKNQTFIPNQPILESLYLKQKKTPDHQTVMRETFT